MTFFRLEYNRRVFLNRNTVEMFTNTFPMFTYLCAVYVYYNVIITSVVFPVCTFLVLYARSLS